MEYQKAICVCMSVFVCSILQCENRWGQTIIRSVSEADSCGGISICETPKITLGHLSPPIVFHLRSLTFTARLGKIHKGTVCK